MVDYGARVVDLTSCDSLPPPASPSKGGVTETSCALCGQCCCQVTVTLLGMQHKAGGVWKWVCVWGGRGWGVVNYSLSCCRSCDGCLTSRLSAIPFPTNPFFYSFVYLSPHSLLSPIPSKSLFCPLLIRFFLFSLPSLSLAFPSLLFFVLSALLSPSPSPILQ